MSIPAALAFVVVAAGYAALGYLAMIRPLRVRFQNDEGGASS